MNRNDAAILMIRGFSIYAIFLAIEYIASGYLVLVIGQMFTMKGNVSALQIAGVLVPLIIFLAIGISLFYWSQAIATRILPPPTEVQNTYPRPDIFYFASLAFAVVGVIIFLYALPRVIALAIYVATTPDAFRNFSLSTLAGIGSAAELALGFLLFLYSRTFATAWCRKQLPKPSNE